MIDSKEVTFYNASHVDIDDLLDLIEGDRLTLNLKDHFLVYQNTIGWVLMSYTDMSHYARGLIEANPDLWPADVNYGVMTIPMCEKIIENTLDNERVVRIKSKA